MNGKTLCLASSSGSRFADSGGTNICAFLQTEVEHFVFFDDTFLCILMCSGIVTPV